MFNFIPSISAITGVSPQRYFWRTSIALHVGPRFIIAICYKSYYDNMLNHVKDSFLQNKGRLLMNVAFWLHLVEITSLCGVTYISNRENYSKFDLMVKDQVNFFLRDSDADGLTDICFTASG